MLSNSEEFIEELFRCLVSSHDGLAIYYRHLMSHSRRSRPDFGLINHHYIVNYIWNPLKIANQVYVYQILKYHRLNINHILIYTTIYSETAGDSY